MLLNSPRVSQCSRSLWGPGALQSVRVAFVVSGLSHGSAYRAFTSQVKFAVSSPCWAAMLAVLWPSSTKRSHRFWLLILIETRVKKRN